MELETGERLITSRGILTYKGSNFDAVLAMGECRFKMLHIWCCMLEYLYWFYFYTSLIRGLPESSNWQKHEEEQMKLYLQDL